MAKNREASQFNSLVNVNDTTGQVGIANSVGINTTTCLLYTSPSPRDKTPSRMPSSA